MPTLLKLNGKADWDSTIPTLTQPNCSVNLETGHTIEAGLELGVSFFECTLCKKVEFSSQKAFQVKDLDIKQKCHSCHKLTAVRYWKCVCGERWYQCPVHRHRTTPHSAVNKVEGQPTSKSPGTKRKRAQRDTLREDIIREGPTVAPIIDPGSIICLGTVADAAQIDYGFRLRSQLRLRNASLRRLRRRL